MHAKHALESVNGKIIGCILNGAQSRHQSYYYSRYYGAYGYYESGEKSKKRKGKTKEAKSGFASEFSDEFKKLQVLQEPLWAILSSGWDRLTHFVKGQRPTDETKLER